MFRNFCSFALSCLSFMFVFQNITEAQSCNSQINVTGWDKYYEWSTSDIISSTAVGYFLDWKISDTLALAQAAERGCLPGISKYGFSFTGDDFSWTGFMFGVVGTPLTPSYNEQVVNIAMPDIGGCEGPPIQEIQYMGGSTGLYAFSIGSGTYVKKIRSATFHICQNLVVETTSTTPIEIPVAISGTVVAAESLGDRDAGDQRVTRATAHLELVGTVGSVGINQSVDADSSNGFPDNHGIDFSQRIVIASGPGKYTIPIDVTGKAETKVGAKGAGFFGLIAGAATANADLPFSIGGPTGPNGTPLPSGVLIRDENKTAVYADTRVFPGKAKLTVSFGTIQQDDTNAQYNITVKLTDKGPGEANNIEFTSATLNGKSLIGDLPQFSGRIVPIWPGPTAEVPLAFPLSAGVGGKRVPLKVQGTYNGGTFKGTFHIRLPLK